MVANRARALHVSDRHRNTLPHGACTELAGNWKVILGIVPGCCRRVLVAVLLFGRLFPATARGRFWLERGRRIAADTADRANPPLPIEDAMLGLTGSEAVMNMFAAIAMRANSR
jgi:hypothetical protein